MLANSSNPKNWPLLLKGFDHDDIYLTREETECLLHGLNTRNDNRFEIGDPALKDPMEEPIIADNMTELRTTHIDCAPNQRQLAYSHYASSFVGSGTVSRIGVFLGVGGGKSRVSATIGWHALITGSAQQVTFVYPTNHLCQRERNQFNGIFVRLGFEAKVNWVTDAEL